MRIHPYSTHSCMHEGRSSVLNCCVCWAVQVHAVETNNICAPVCVSISYLMLG
jgi:hypothetical protein